MSDTGLLAAPPVPLPNVSYGPFRLMEAVPWLMLATALRMAGWSAGVPGLVLRVCSDVAVFFAFLLAARRMIELTDGRTGLGGLDFAAQTRLARKVMIPVYALMILSSALVFRYGAQWTGLHLLIGFDGIAFDQFTWLGMAWSAFLAAVVLLTLLQADASGRVDLFSVFRELWARSLCMVPAIIALAVANIALSLVQGEARMMVYIFWQTSATPVVVKKLLYFFFTFGFAALRLWMTLAILTFALRESWRRGDVPGGPAATPV